MDILAAPVANPSVSSRRVVVASHLCCEVNQGVSAQRRGEALPGTLVTVFGKCQPVI